MLYANESEFSTMKALAFSVSAGISDPSPPPKEIRFFPTRNLKPGSVQFFSEGLLGHRFLVRGFLGTYVEGGKGELEIKVEAKNRDRERPERILPLSGNFQK